jgi:hypothetical protein
MALCHRRVEIPASRLPGDPLPELIHADPGLTLLDLASFLGNDVIQDIRHGFLSHCKMPMVEIVEGLTAAPQRLPIVGPNLDFISFPLPYGRMRRSVPELLR